jgi:hypothetical protein
MESVAPSISIDSFISRWATSGGAERANYQLFLTELCDLLEVPRPDPAGPDSSEHTYVFERAVRFDNLGGTHSTGRIDLTKRGCSSVHFCEGKQK